MRGRERTLAQKQRRRTFSMHLDPKTRSSFRFLTPCSQLHQALLPRSLHQDRPSASHHETSLAKLTPVTSCRVGGRAVLPAVHTSKNPSPRTSQQVLNSHLWDWVRCPTRLR